MKPRLHRPDARGRFGDYGGQFAPETLDVGAGGVGGGVCFRLVRPVVRGGVSPPVGLVRGPPHTALPGSPFE